MTHPFYELMVGGVLLAPFVRYAAAGITVWIMAQTLVNLGAVIGLLPIVGIPLPLLSYGGSALLPTLIAIGMLLSFAKAEPGAQAALKETRRPLLGLMSSWRTPGRTEAAGRGRHFRRFLPASRRRPADELGHDQ